MPAKAITPISSDTGPRNVWDIQFSFTTFRVALDDSAFPWQWLLPCCSALMTLFVLPVFYRFVRRTPPQAAAQAMAAEVESPGP
jgi:hypothetical protein